MSKNKTNVFLNKTKGAIEIDYILALSMFLIFFALTVQYITDYFTTVREGTAVATARSEAISLLGIADRSPEPAGWPQITNDSNLVLLMHFNNNTQDYSGRGNNGAAVGGVNCSPSVTGKFFGACGFDGASGYVSAGNIGVPANGTGTIAGWFYFKNLSVNAGLIGFLYKQSAGIYIVNTNDLFQNLNLNTDRWYHLAITYSGGTNTAVLYINAVNYSITQQSGSHTIDALNSFQIGMVANMYFNGTADEVAVWNRSLSASEINGLYQRRLNLMGLRTNAFRFIAVVNNTKPNLVNTSEGATALDLSNELVRFNMSSFGFTGIDYNSVVIYNETNSQVPFQINGSNITFSVNITANASRQFTIYFDDDSVFGEKTQNIITDVDNLTETFFPVENIYAVQYEKMRQLNASNYTNIRSTADMESSFHIKLADADTNATIMDYGAAVPRRGNIVALQRHVVYQNSTAGVNNGKLTIQTW